MHLKVLFALVILFAVRFRAAATSSSDERTRERQNGFKGKNYPLGAPNSNSRKLQREESTSGESEENEKDTRDRAQLPAPAHSHRGHRHPLGPAGAGGGVGGGGGGGAPFSQYSYGYSIPDHEFDHNQNQGRYHNEGAQNYQRPTPPQHFFHHSPYDRFQQYDYDAERERAAKSGPEAPPPPRAHQPHHPHQGHQGVPALRHVIPVARLASPFPYPLGYSPPVTPFGFLPHLAPPITYLAQPTPVISQSVPAVVASATHGAQIALPVAHAGVADVPYHVTTAGDETQLQAHQQ